MLLGDSNAIYIGDTSIDAVYIGSDLVWSAEKGGLDPYGRNWNLYGVQPCEYKYLTPGILLKGLSGTGSYMFTCAESPERIDFTTIKSVQIKYTGYDGVARAAGGIASIPVTHSTNPKSQIVYTALELASSDSTSVTLNCESVGGQQFLLLYSDLDYTMEITELVIEHYAEDAIIDLTSSIWEQRNFQYESDTVITCTNDIQIPVGASDIAIHVSTHDSGGLKSCLAFLDENKNIISYGDNWQGTNPTDVTVSTHFQSIPSNAAYFQIAVGRAPNMTSLITPQDLKECIVCFSIDNIYTPLQYIQSTNCQTINTGYIPNENSRIEAEFMLYTSVHNEWGQALFGNGSWRMYYNRNRTLQTEYQFGSGNITTTASVLPYHKRFKLVCDKNGATWYDTEGVQIGNVSVTGTSPGASPLYIGSDSNSYYSEYRIYSFKIYEDDTLVMNLIPVQRNEDDVCGLLDTISMKFFADAGRQGAGYYSDRFEDSYTQLEAVDTDGNLYVNTDYVHKSNTKIVIDSIPDIADNVNTSRYIFGTLASGWKHDEWFLCVNDYNSGRSYGQRNQHECDDFDAGTFNNRCTVTAYGLDFTVMQLDGTTVTKTVSSIITNGINTMYLFYINNDPWGNSQPSFTRFYNAKIIETANDIDTIITNLVPVKRKFDNIIVLYDTISNSEYPPVGGTFTESTMPIMDGITNYYDCKRDVTIGGYWKSQVKFYEKSYDMPLGGNISIADDGSITMTGDSSGYAWFYSATADYTTRSAYVIAKADASTIHSQNPVLLGVSSAGGDKNTVSIATQRNTSVLDLDLWGATVESVVNSSDYHVCVWTRNGSINSFYVDGVLIGTLDVSNKYYVTYSTYQGCEEQLWGVACLFRGNSYNSWGDKVQKYFKFIAIADTAHTSEQIAENTAWLKKYYNLD